MTLQYYQRTSISLAYVKSSNETIHASSGHNGASVFIPVMGQRLAWGKGAGVLYAHGRLEGWDVGGRLRGMNGDLEDKMV